jgi:hypothetical protein
VRLGLVGLVAGQRQKADGTWMEASTSTEAVQHARQHNVALRPPANANIDRDTLHTLNIALHCIALHSTPAL